MGAAFFTGADKKITFSISKYKYAVSGRDRTFAARILHEFITCYIVMSYKVQERHNGLFRGFGMERLRKILERRWEVFSTNGLYNFTKERYITPKPETLGGNMNGEQSAVALAAQDSALRAALIQAQPGKYLTYRLGDEQYGIDIGKVQEIIGLMPMTRVPRTPNCMRGVINLRGKVIPVVDLRMKFNLDKVEDTRETCIIVMNLFQEDHVLLTLGIVVDAVTEVADFSMDRLQPRPAFGAKVMTNLILGIGRIDERVVILLDADRLVTAEEISVVDPAV